MKNTIQDKTKLVNSVFSEVYNKYDLMNDVMSLGVHRIWKDKLIGWMNPSRNSSLIDVASGTGDIAKLFSLRNKNSSTVTCIEPNEDMFKKGKNNLINFKNIKWIKSRAESLPVEDNMYDFYSISYGIRNVSDINKTLREAYRVLKPGGRFMCLEFSKIDNELLNFLYKNYSKVIPTLGKYIVGTSKPYEYLIKGRVENVSTAQRIAHYLYNQGHDVIVSLVSPYIDQREEFKKLIGEDFIEIYVHTSEARERDHFKALAYKSPNDNFISIDTTKNTPEESFVELIAEIKWRKKTLTL